MLTSRMMDDTIDMLGRDALLFLPELLVCFVIVWLLLARVVSSRKSHLGWTALIFTLLALFVTFIQWFGGIHIPGWIEFEFKLGSIDTPGGEELMYGGLLVYDSFTLFMRLFLFSSVALVILLTLQTGIPDREDSGDFYCLLLGATLGMSLMASANHLLMVFLAVEMASLPSYALAGFLKGRRQSSEAALKYVVYGGGASGIMLYGISLITGKFGTGYLPNLAVCFGTVFQSPAFDPVLLLGLFFVLIGVAFKLSAVPFHFWCPDVFEGAAAEVGAFLSVVSKGAALALLGRLVLSLSGVAYGGQTPGSGNAVWQGAANILIPALAFFAAITATFGNFAAYLQTNLKRLLAYSTIAHAGYMMMGFATLNRDGAEAVLFYLIAYLATNLGAFAVVAFLRNQTGSEELESFRGLVRKSPLMVVTLAVFLLSLLGIPPLIGFFGKFQIFRVLYDGGDAFLRSGQTGLGYTLFGLLVIGGLNTVVSVVYYIKVIKVMILEASPEEESEHSAPAYAVPTGAAVYASLMAAAVLLVSFFQDPFLNASRDGASRFSKPTPMASQAVAEVKQ